MTDERWARIERIYHAAPEQPPSQRSALLRHEADGDLELIAEIESLLMYDGRQAAFARYSALELAARALAEDQPRFEAEPVPTDIASYRILQRLGGWRHGRGLPRAG